MRAATARAFPNLALVKYWGKRDEALILPCAGSLSLTLDAFPTVTSVTPLPGAAHDRFELNGTVLSDGEGGGGEAAQRVARFLDLVRERSGTSQRALVRSTNEAPTGAGLASSAAGFAALAAAAARAYGLPEDPRSLSRLARRGSGSAARSIIAGVSVWHEGDDESSVAEPIAAPEMHMVIVTVDAAQKAVSSRAAMRRTALTSPFFPAWIESTRATLPAMVSACERGDFTRIGRITELHALRMHALIQSADPPIRYLSPGSIAVFDAVGELRTAGVEAYATADAGPNVAVLVQPEDGPVAATALESLGSVRLVGPGPGARVLGPEDAAGRRSAGDP